MPVETPSISTGMVRYAFQSSHITGADKVNWRLFYPGEEALGLSVSERGARTDQEVWEIGLAVGERRGQNLHGRVDFERDLATQNGLSFELQPTDIDPQHGNLIGWPDGKENRISKAQDLVQTLRGKKRATTTA